LPATAERMTSDSSLARSESLVGETKDCADNRGEGERERYRLIKTVAGMMMAEKTMRAKG